MRSTVVDVVCVLDVVNVFPTITTRLPKATDRTFITLQPRYARGGYKVETLLGITLAAFSSSQRYT